MKDDFVATAVVQSTGIFNNKTRMELLLAVTRRVGSMIHCDGVILFPAGYFNAGQGEANAILPWVGREIGSNLAGSEQNIVICVGIDGWVQAQMPRDQLVVAIGKQGVKALGRKFYPTKRERGKIHFANNHLLEEQGYSRIFSLNTRRYYIAVCYDVFGIKRLALTNPEVGAILNCVHGFYLPKQGAAGVSLFTRHGFAGASKQWGCPVFGTAVFFNRSVPKDWPSGVYWNQGSKSTKEWAYSDNPIKELESLCVRLSQEIVFVKAHDLADCPGFN